MTNGIFGGCFGHINMSHHLNQSGEPCSDTKRYSLPVVKGFGQKTFAYQGCYLWNLLPQFVRNSKNVSAFKSNAKQHLLERL